MIDRKHRCTTDPEEPLARLFHMLEVHASGNIAPAPVAMMYTEGEWHVDVHVKLPGDTEYEYTSRGSTLTAALLHAATFINDQKRHREQARKNAETFGLTY